MERKFGIQSFENHLKKSQTPTALNQIFGSNSCDIEYEANFVVLTQTQTSYYGWAKSQKEGNKNKEQANLRVVAA